MTRCWWVYVCCGDGSHTTTFFCKIALYEMNVRRRRDGQSNKSDEGRRIDGDLHGVERSSESGSLPEGCYTSRDKGPLLRPAGWICSTMPC